MSDALELADQLERAIDSDIGVDLPFDAAAELRRQADIIDRMLAIPDRISKTSSDSYGSGWTDARMEIKARMAVVVAEPASDGDGAWPVVGGSGRADAMSDAREIADRVAAALPVIRGHLYDETDPPVRRWPEDVADLVTAARRQADEIANLTTDLADHTVRSATNADAIAAARAHADTHPESRDVIAGLIDIIEAT